jgi:hypothetical protein
MSKNKIKEWQIFFFINWGMQHPCNQFVDNHPMLYADRLYCRKSSKINK